MSAVALPGIDLLDDLSIGVAGADPDTWCILYENECFRAWFPAPDTAADGLVERIPALLPERARDRLGRGRPFRVETEVRQGTRVTPVQVEIRPVQQGDTRLLLVEAHNVSRQKEAEYMLDSYARMSERQARALEQEKERAERLLLNIMPRSVAAELQDFGTTTPQSFESASVLMLDFVGFTEMAITRDPGALIAELNDVFTSFDQIMSHCRAERIKTIGDAYMAVAGLPEGDPDHAYHLARAALRIRRFLERRNRSAANRWRCRMGLACGPVIGSIVGVQKYVYDIFGPTVNLASRLEAAAEPLQILVSAEYARRVADEFVVRRVGTIDLKGLGTEEVFALEDELRKGRV